MPKPKSSAKSHGSHHKRMGGTNTRSTRDKGERKRFESDMKTYGGSAKTNSTSWRDTCFEKQLFDFMIVVDFECTCEKNVNDYPNEIIEFPAVLIDIRNGGKILKAKSFRSYAKPWRNPELTLFCTTLTGIEQRHVNIAPDLPTVVKHFQDWYLRTIPKGAKVILATDGPWDFRNFILKNSVKRDHVAFPTIFYEYIDIRTTFSNYFNHGRPLKLEKMLSKMHLSFQGRQHCGFDDAVNIARLAVAMMTKGCIFSFLISLPLDEDKYHYDMPGAVLYRRDDGRSGLLTREHVEERAKAVYGDAYYSYGGSTFASGEGGDGAGVKKGGGAGGFATALLMALGLRSQAYGSRNESPDAMDLIDVDVELAKLAEVSPSTSEDDVSESDDEEEEDSQEEHEEEDDSAAEKKPSSSSTSKKTKKPTTSEGAAMLLNKQDKVKREVKLAMLKTGALELSMELVNSDDIDRRVAELIKAASSTKKQNTVTMTELATPTILDHAQQLSTAEVSEATDDAVKAASAELRKRATTELLVESMVELRRRRKESRRNRRNNYVEAVEAVHAKNRDISQRRKESAAQDAASIAEHASLVAQSKTIRMVLFVLFVVVVVPLLISFVFST